MMLGSEIIIVSVDDARKLIKALLKPDNVPELQRLGVLDVLDALRAAVKRYDYGEGDYQ